MSNLPIGEIFSFIFGVTFVVNVFLKIYDIKITYDANKNLVFVENTGNKSMTIIDVQVTNSDKREINEDVQIFYNPFLAAQQKKPVFNLKEDFTDVTVIVKCKCYVFITITTTVKIAKSGYIEKKGNQLKVSLM